VAAARVRIAARLWAAVGSALLACSSPAAAPEDPVLAYLRRASHLSESDRDALLARRPFVGMTLEEAELALVLEDRLATVDDRPILAVFGDGRGRRYTVRFGGSPPAVRSWTPHPIAPHEPRDVGERQRPPLPASR
jgi:hypothetical protein